MSQIGFMLVT